MAYLGAAPPAPVLELVILSDGLWKGDNPLGSPRPNVEELVSLGRRLQVQVMLSDDALRVPGLECRLAHRPVFGHEHRDERVPAMPSSA
jgi:hypothetical protein